MGKQLYYWMSYQDFIRIANVALDLGCSILKATNGKIEYGKDISIISENIYQYYFLPRSVCLERNESINLSQLRFTCQVIESGFSRINHKKKEIIRSRIYVGTGHFLEQGDFIKRKDSLTELYNKLVYSIKKAAPYVELTDTYISTKEETYLQEMTYTHKEYVSPEYLKLKKMEGYRLRV